MKQKAFFIIFKGLSLKKIRNFFRSESPNLRSRLCDYSDVYILLSGTITIAEAGADDAAKRLDKRNSGVIFKNWVPSTDYISETILR